MTDEVNPKAKPRQLWQLFVLSAALFAGVVLGVVVDRVYLRVTQHTPDHQRNVMLPPESDDRPAATVVTDGQKKDIRNDPRVIAAVELLEVWIDAHLEYEHIPGISVAVVHDQDLLWNQGFGYADLERLIRSLATPSPKPSSLQRRRMPPIRRYAAIPAYTLLLPGVRRRS